jgi:hypothetical protein
VVVVSPERVVDVAVAVVVVVDAVVVGTGDVDAATVVVAWVVDGAMVVGAVVVAVVVVDVVLVDEGVDDDVVELLATVEVGPSLLLLCPAITAKTMIRTPPARKIAHHHRFHHAVCDSACVARSGDGVEGGTDGPGALTVTERRCRRSAYGEIPLTDWSFVDGADTATDDADLGRPAHHCLNMSHLTR